MLSSVFKGPSCARAYATGTGGSRGESLRSPSKLRATTHLTTVRLAGAPHSSEVQQPTRTAAVLSRHPHTHRAASLNIEQERVGSLHPGIDIASKIPLASNRKSEGSISVIDAIRCRIMPYWINRRRCAAPGLALIAPGSGLGRPAWLWAPAPSQA